jgi:S-DNA-T family DNA segregation ATPase FtsK/SpoIIIE
MPQSNVELTDPAIVPEGLKTFARRRVSETAGLCILLTAGLCAVSLAGWAVTDPSLNHAADKAVNNFLGAPGAVLADLAMQSLGLGAIIVLAAPVAWGLRLIAHRPFTRPVRRVTFWVLSCLVLAGFLSALAAPATWPLPSGLGGLAGDKIFAAVNWLFALFLQNRALQDICSGFVLFISGATLLIYAIGTTPVALLEPGSKMSDGSTELAARSLGAVGHLRLRFAAFCNRVRARLARRGPVPETIDAAIPRQSRFSGLVRRCLNYLLSERMAPPAQRIEPHFDSQPVFGPEPMQDRDDFQDAPTAAAAPAPRRRARPRPAKPAGKFTLPPVGLLATPKSRAANPELSRSALEENARALEGVFDDFGIRGEIINAKPGPVVTLYELEPAPGIKSSRVIGLADDIARSMSAISARVAVVPGRNVIGIELPNSKREFVYLREMLASEAYTKAESGLALALGKTIGGEPVIADLTRMPHLLIAGTTGSGKSVGINTMILSLLFRHSPERCKLIMVDPKMLELSVYDDIPHLLTPVVTDPKKAVVALKWAVREMEDRYKKMSKIGVRNIDGFNARLAQARQNGEVITRTVQTGFDADTGQPVLEQEEMSLEPMPYIVVIIDEMADLMMVAGKEIEGAVQRLAQMARAAGIHMITATQRPSVDVITGTIKANFPTRISFQVTSKVDSRTILGEQGAEQLLGQGDMLYMAGGGRISRVHGPYVSDNEVEKIVKHLKKQGVPEYLDAVIDDSEAGGDIAGGVMTENTGNDLYDQAVAIVARDKKASTSYIQRRLSIGYNRAATLIEQMEEQGVISPANHAGKREVLIGEPGEGVNA